MKRLWLGLTAAFGLAMLLPAWGDAYFPVGDVAPLADLEAETRFQLKTLEVLLKDNPSYDDMTNRKNLIPRAAGVLAVMGQAIAEHPDKAKSKIAGPELRDAARRVIASASYEDAVTALAGIRAALAGAKTGMSEVDHPWNKLMSLRRLMEEVEARHSDLRTVYVKAKKGKPFEPSTDAVHASTLAVLALALHADSHEVKDPTAIPTWEKLSKDFRKQLTDLSQAVHKGDAGAVLRTFPMTTQSCTACHEEFR